MRVWQFIRSRIAVLAAVLVLGGALAWGYSEYGELEPAWGEMGVPMQAVTFGDLRAVMGCIDCTLLELNPYVESNRCYPLGGRFNLPRAWLWLRFLGANEERTNVIGFIYLLLEFTAFALIFRPKRAISNIAVFLTILSPPMLLGMERGNGDLLIFSLLVIGLALAMRLTLRGRRNAVGWLLTYLTAMKIYPAVAVTAIIRQRKDIAAAIVIFLAGLAALLLSSWDVLGEVYANTPTTTYLAFGNVNIFVAMSRFGWFGLTEDFDALRFTADLVTVLVIAVSAFVARRVAKRRPDFFPRLDPDDLRDVVTMATLAEFCIVFCMGSSYYYRLLLLVGGLAGLIKAHDENPRPLTRFAIVTLTIFFWFSGGMVIWPLWPYFTLVYEPLDWLVFVGAGSWLLVTLYQRCFGAENGQAVAVAA